MKNWMIGALVVLVAAAVVPTASEAKRMGGGSSAGMQRNMPARTAPDAAPAKPANAAAQQPGAAAAPGAPAPKRNWMGPIAGLAAGLGIAALMSHLGMGEAFGNFLMLALLAVAAVFLISFLMRRFGPARAPALATAGAGQMQPAQPAWTRDEDQGRLERSRLEATPAAVATPAADGAITRAFVPAAFDSEGFVRTAKLIFIRMQAANDSADLDDLRRFTTPELFAELRLQLQERGAAAQHTDVRKVEAEVLDVTHEAERQVVSVRFHGQVVEEAGAAPNDFDEVWHLVKPHDDSRPWAIAGIEQRH
jgi:predicted lipid-binding transport protein (Tim44 family)